MRILVTGGTGSFGQAFVREHLPVLCPSYQMVVFSRDELKQHDMRAAGIIHDHLRYFIGDVRDVGRLRRAFRDVDVVVHAAALKQVESCEYNPLEAKKTNVDGTENVINAALDAGVGRVLMIGTDKAVDPVNMYGVTKAAAEKVMVDANAYSGKNGTRFSCTRYGNVISSRGAVLPIFQAQYRAGLPLTITDPNMTRFVLTLDQSVEFVLGCLGRMEGGEVFVPRLKTVTVATIADAVNEFQPKVIVGRRAGEKQHELLVSANEPELAAANDLPFPYGSNSDPADRLGVEGFRELAGIKQTVAA